MKPTGKRKRLTQVVKLKKRANARLRGVAKNRIKKTLSDALDDFFKPLQ